MDFYALLGVSRGATEDAIKQGYKREALKWHPDKNPDDRTAAEDRFKRIAKAYEVLRDPSTRRLYDQGGETAVERGSADATGFDATSDGDAEDVFHSRRHHHHHASDSAEDYGWSGMDPRSHRQGGNGEGFHRGHHPFVFHDPFEIFRQVFGGGNVFEFVLSPLSPLGARRSRFGGSTLDYDDGLAVPPRSPFGMMHDPFFGGRGMMSMMGGGGGMFAEMDRMMSDMMSMPTTGGMMMNIGGGGGSGGMTFMSTSSSSFGGGSGLAGRSVSQTTVIENGRKVTRTVKSTMGRDGTVHEDVDEAIEEMPMMNVAGHRIHGYYPTVSVGGRHENVGAHHQQEERRAAVPSSHYAGERQTGMLPPPPPAPSTRYHLSSDVDDDRAYAAPLRANTNHSVAQQEQRMPPPPTWAHHGTTAASSVGDADTRRGAAAAPSSHGPTSTTRLPPRVTPSFSPSTNDTSTSSHRARPHAVPAGSGVASRRSVSQPPRFNASSSRPSVPVRR